MHIPDGFLATPVWLALDLGAAASVGILARRTERTMEEGRAPLLGVMGAFVFAAQMINFPVGAATSGHIVGGALLAASLGPGAATIVMTAILAVQALVFQDGGLLALGANVFNMAIAGVWAGYLPFRLLGSGTWRSVGVFLGGALSVLVASSLALAELRLSGVPMPGAVVGLSMGLFALSALIEGAITLAVFQAVERMNRGWVRPGPESPKRAWGLLATAALALASVGAVFASALPDGLEKLAEELGIASRAINLLASPLAEYELRAADNPWLRKAGAGLIGLAVVFLVCAAAGRLLVGKRARGTA